MEIDGLEICPMGVFGRDAGLRFLVAGADVQAVVPGRIDAVRRLLGSRRSDEVLLWHARRTGRTVAAALAVRNPGCYSMLSYAPVTAPGVDAGAMQLLIGKISAAALDAGSAFVQALVAPERREDVSLLESAGFELIAELIYLKLPLAAAVRSGAAGSELATLTWRRYGQFTDDELGDVIRATYEDSQDCPDLAELRGTREVIAAHKAGGSFCPDTWWLADVGGCALGCVLVNDSPRPAIVEVVYLGVVPGFRRRGLGRTMLDHAVGTAAARGKAVMSLAVDSRNTAALKLYESAGFDEIFRRLVYIRSSGTHDCEQHVD